MIRLHEKLELTAWSLVLRHKISIDTYRAIVEWSNSNFETWLHRYYGFVA